MPRQPRSNSGGHVFHVLNRRVDRRPLFETSAEFLMFEHLLESTLRRIPIRLCGFCLMPNHWHLVLWPTGAADMSRFMHLLSTTHSMRWRRRRDVVGEGHVYQARYKSFPVQDDSHFLRLLRYVERNALRANLVRKAEDWRFSSAWRRVQLGWSDTLLSPGPVPITQDWVERVNSPLTKTELAEVRMSVRRGRPLGTRDWQRRTASLLGLETTLRDIGRPRNDSVD